MVKYKKFKKNNKKYRAKKSRMVRYSRTALTGAFMRVSLRKTGTATTTSISLASTETFKLDDFNVYAKFTAIYEQFRIIKIKQTIYPTVQLGMPAITTVGTDAGTLTNQGSGGLTTATTSNIVDRDQVNVIMEMLLGVKIDRDDVQPLSNLSDCLNNPQIKILNLGRGKPVRIKWKPNILIQTTNTGNKAVEYNKWLDTEDSADETYYGLNKLYHVNGASSDFPITFRIITEAIVEFKRFRTDE